MFVKAIALAVAKVTQLEHMINIPYPPEVNVGTNLYRDEKPKVSSPRKLHITSCVLEEDDDFISVLLQQGRELH